MIRLKNLGVVSIALAIAMLGFGISYAGILDRGVEDNAAIDTTRINFLSGDPQNTAIEYSPGYNKGIQLPKVATASLLTATSYEGVIVYDDTLNAAYVSDGTSWNSVAGSTKWNAIVDPDGNGSITFSTYTNIFTGAAVAADQHQIVNTGNMGDVSILVVEQNTGNPTDGTALEVKTADTNIDGVVVTNSTADLTADTTLLTLGYTDDGDANGIFINCLDNVSADSKFSVSTDGAVICGTIGSASIVSTGSITGNALVATTGAFANTVTLDDGIGASPSFVLQDGTDETAVFTKQDGADVTMTILAADSFRVATGNLRVGVGVPGTCPMDGEDLYVVGQSEFDSAMTLDGLLTATAGATITGTVNLNNNSNNTVNIGTGTCTSTITIGNTTNMVNIISRLTAAGQVLIVDADTTAHTGITGCLDLGMTSLTDNASVVDVKVTSTHAAAVTQIGTKYDLDTDATANTGYIEAININASDVTEVGGTTVFRGLAVENTLDTGYYALTGAAMKAIEVAGDATPTTLTTGVIDVDVTSLTDTASAVNVKITSTHAGVHTQRAIALDLDDDATAGAGFIEGIYVNASDIAPVGGSSTIRGISLANTLNQGIYEICGAAQQALFIDAATTATTLTTGVVDINMKSGTNAAYAANILVNSVATLGTESIGAIQIDLDTDANHAGVDYIDGIYISASDVTEVAGITAMNGIYIGTGIDIGLYGALDAAAQGISLNANTTTHTGITGVIDVDVKSATDNCSAMDIYVNSIHAAGTTQIGLKLDLDDDATAGAGFIEAININASDVTPVGGTTTIRGLMLENTLNEGINALCGAGMKALVVDATTTLSTQATGVIDIDYRTATSGLAAGINLDVESDVAGGASETVEGIRITLDDDANTATDMVKGIYVTSDGDAVGLQYAMHVSGAGIDAALQADNGYVRIGTGSTPDVAPGDDDLFVEGTAEIDGAARIDGILTMGAAAIHVFKGADIASPAGGELTLGAGTYFDITGVNNITSIAAASSIVGRVVILQFDAILTFTDGANLYLAGNLVTTAGDTITLVSDGVGWFELSRSVN